MYGEKVSNIMSKATTGKARIAYANIWEPKKDKNGKEKYSVMVLIPKTDLETLDKIRVAVESCYTESKDTLKGKGVSCPALGAIHTPLRDGDEEHPGEELYSGMMFLNASGIYAPDIIDSNKEDITDHEEVYSGCYCRVSLGFYAYNTNGSKGIACSLRAIMKIADGERLGSKGSARDDFD